MALPPISGQRAPRTLPASDARTAAQRAFFEAALGRTRAAEPLPPPAAPSTAAPAHPSGPAARVGQDVSTPQQPDANARPGSIVNIRV
jgi:hypothetical protein